MQRKECRPLFANSAIVIVIRCGEFSPIKTKLNIYFIIKGTKAWIRQQIAFCPSSIIICLGLKFQELHRCTDKQTILLQVNSRSQSAKQLVSSSVSVFIDVLTPKRKVLKRPFLLQLASSIDRVVGLLSLRGYSAYRCAFSAFNNHGTKN